MRWRRCQCAKIPFRRRQEVAAILAAGVLRYRRMAKDSLTHSPTESRDSFGNSLGPVAEPRPCVLAGSGGYGPRDPEKGQRACCPVTSRRSRCLTLAWPVRLKQPGPQAFRVARGPLRALLADKAGQEGRPGRVHPEGLTAVQSTADGSKPTTGPTGSVLPSAWSWPR